MAHFKKTGFVRRKWVLGAGILISLTIVLWASRQRTWVSQQLLAFPHRLLFSERTNFWTSQDLEVIRRVGIVVQYQEKTRMNLSLDQRNKALDSLSTIVQQQLTRGTYSSPVNCSSRPTLLCGHFQECGFACQIHHRMSCVALSYMMGFPLIHDEVKGWGFKKKWKDAFQPIGSNCQIGPNTITVNWAEHGPQLSKPRKCFACGLELVPSFIENGFIVPKEIGQLVEKLHGNPFLWWAGQFANFTLRLSENQASILETAKASIGMTNLTPTFGLHVRMTDKITEDIDSRHDIKIYFDEIDVFRNRNHILGNDLTQLIFIASDNHTILPLAKEIYPMEKILGFKATKTLQNQKQRVDALDDIIRDTLVLAQSEYIICGYSSNVCRLLLELLSVRHADILDRIKSLDGRYRYHVYGLVAKQDVIFST